MHDHRPATGRPAEVRSYEKATRAVSHLFPAADRQLITDYAEPFTNKNGYPVDPDAIPHVIEVIVQDDPLTQAIDDLEARHPDWRAHKHNDAVLHVGGNARNTFLLAAEALDAIPDTTTRMAAVFATGTTDGWTIAIRCDGTLIHVEKDLRGGLTWQQYRLGNLVTPTRISRERDLATPRTHPQRSPRPALPSRYRGPDSNRVRPVGPAIPVPSGRVIHLTATGRRR